MSEISGKPQARSTRYMQFTKRQRNELIDTLVKGGINIAECDRELTNDGVRIFHGPTGSLATFYEDTRGRYRGSLVVEDGQEAEIYSSDWKEVLNQFADWAAEVKYVATTPDLWKLIQNSV